MSFRFLILSLLFTAILVGQDSRGTILGRITDPTNSVMADAEVRGRGVGVTTICPGYVRTPMTAANPYPMPFLIEADDAARRMARVIASGRRFAVIPWQMALVGRVLLALPDAWYDRLASRFGRKPRKSPAGS